MKKILIVGLTNGVGGVETFISNLNKYIQHDNIQISYLTHQNINNKYLDDLSIGNSKIYKIKGIKENPFSSIKELFKFYKENKYDVVHLNECDATYFIYALPVLFNKNIKLIVHSHNGASQHKILHKILAFIQNKRANVMWSCSDVAGKWMFENKKYEIIHNGVDIEKFKYSYKKNIDVRKEFKIPDNKIILGSIARFNEQKNHKKIIDVFSEYHKKNNNSVLMLVGDGEEKGKIIEYVNNNNLTDSVIFAGIRNDVPSILSAFDLFLLPSLYEGLPFVCIESQSCALPILASNTVSSEIKLSELVYFESLNSSNKEWADKVELIINNKLEREKFNSAKIMKNAGYDIKEVCKKIKKEYIKE